MTMSKSSVCKQNSYSEQGIGNGEYKFTSHVDKYHMQIEQVLVGRPPRAKTTIGRAEINPTFYESKRNKWGLGVS